MNDADHLCHAAARGTLVRRIRDWQPRRGVALWGFARVELVCRLIIGSVPILRGDDGFWAGSPSKAVIHNGRVLADTAGRLKYERIVEFDSPETSACWSAEAPKCSPCSGEISPSSRTRSMSRPPGLPCYFCAGDDVAVFRRSRIHDHYASGAADWAARASGRGPIDWSFVRACWYAQDCYRDECRRLAAAEHDAHADAIARLTHHLAKRNRPARDILDAVQVVASCLGLNDDDAIRIADDALWDVARSSVDA
jgi:hypothetical protein